MWVYSKTKILSVIEYVFWIMLKLFNFYSLEYITNCFNASMRQEWACRERPLALLIGCDLWLILSCLGELSCLVCWHQILPHWDWLGPGVEGEVCNLCTDSSPNNILRMTFSCQINFVIWEEKVITQNSNSSRFISIWTLLSLIRT